ncbi:MAG: protease complex subunit PrcB family protein, partial [Planctomycetota bacterium]
MEPVEIVLAVLHICGVVHWTPAHQKAECLVFHSAAEMTAVWLADGGQPERAPRRYDEVGEIRVFTEDKEHPQPPQISFEKEMVVAVFAGQKPTGGYSVKIENVVHAPAKKTVWVVY